MYVFNVFSSTLVSLLCVSLYSLHFILYLHGYYINFQYSVLLVPPVSLFYFILCHLPGFLDSLVYLVWLHFVWRIICIGHVKAYPVQDQKCTYSSCGGYCHCMQDVILQWAFFFRRITQTSINTNEHVPLTKKKTDFKLKMLFHFLTLLLKCIDI